MIKNGSRLKSQVDQTQIIVVRAAPSLVELRCGGAPMVDLDADTATAELDPEFAGGTAVGKRYVNDDAAEVLVTKAGTGSLSIGRVALQVKEAKPLPASD